jgi:dTDP-4-amino-4,6-dideoxygalactose transaminase
VGRIYLSPPDLRGGERERVLAAIDSGWVAPVGPDLDAFEEELAARCGRAHAVALSSGTAALHLALLELGVGPGDEVVVSTYTFAASANPVVYVGATPVFVDSERRTWNVSPDLLAEAVETRARAGRPPKAAVLVDLYGTPASWDRLLDVLDRHGVAAIDDATEALGAEVGGRSAGSFGVAAALSFNGNKLITTGGGGALVTDDEQLARRARYLSTQARQPVPHYEHVDIGFNYRLSNLLAAFGRAQLATLDDRMARRRQLRARYVEALGGLPGTGWNPVDVDGRSNHWLTVLTVDPATGLTPESLRLALEAVDVESRPTWKPMHQQPVFAGAAAVLDGTSDELFATGLCLPSGSNMSDADQDRVIEVLLAAWTA